MVIMTQTRSLDDMVRSQHKMLVDGLHVEAGNETTRNAISGGLLAFCEHPREWEKLHANPDLLPDAAEEIEPRRRLGEVALHYGSGRYFFTAFGT